MAIKVTVIAEDEETGLRQEQSAILSPKNLAILQQELDSTGDDLKLQLTDVTQFFIGTIYQDLE